MEFLMARVEVGNDEYTAMRDELLAWWRTAPEYVRRELVLMPRYDGKEAADGD